MQGFTYESVNPKSLYNQVSICTIKKEQQTDKLKKIRNMAYGWEWFPPVQLCKHLY